MELNIPAYNEKQIDVDVFVNYWDEDNIEELTVSELKDLIDSGLVKYDDIEEQLLETDYANAIMKLHKGFSGTYEECRDGAVAWTDEDVKWFKEFITGE